nr:malectin domain-containing carbohydrate-binding protein [Prolixibacteraceae bacterium]
PHNFRYHEQWDKTGMLWWTQMTAHIWFDTPEFRENFKQLLHDWVKERRNSPSVVLWGLENESTLPEDFARECTELIRKLDPTSPSQRLVTTCNGGSGTDWNVIQNWSGTYGGDPYIYDEELSEQLLNGEYGAWRSIDFHTEGGFVQDGSLSEDRMTLLMETKVRLGEKASDQSCGQFHWLFNSHDNPGRVQSGEGFRDIDRLGPINYKGAVTIWGEPLDVFYMFRSNYAPKETEPMVYIASHTWLDRWIQPGVKDGIRVYSNCDEVELFNSVDGKPLAKLERGPIGTHFVFDNIDVQYNILKAVGYVNGKEVASDMLMFHHLPEAPGIEKLAGNTTPLTSDNTNYVYRVNCGGADYIDAEGNVWMADRQITGNNSWGSDSWTSDYDGMPAFYGSQRQTYDPIEGTTEWPLIQTFRYGRHKLSYHFPLPDGEYQLELFFTEPWYGTGGGLICDGWRMFDVAVNNQLVIDDLDIWNEVGHDKLLKKTVTAEVENGQLVISFPEVKSGQAVISAIAISTSDKAVVPAPASDVLLTGLEAPEGWNLKTWMNTGDQQFTDENVAFSGLLPVLYGAEWIQASSSNNTKARFKLNASATVFAGIHADLSELPVWLDDWMKIEGNISNNAGGVFNMYRKDFNAGSVIEILPYKLNDEKKIPVIAALPVTTLDDPIDMRTAKIWQAEDGVVFGNARKTTYLDKEVQMAPDQNGAIGLQFSVGLASKYGLQFRFVNLAGKNLEADVEILAADGRLMWAGEWIFPPTPPKWKSYVTNTQTVINAGTYTIKISPREKGPLYFDWVKVQ